MSIYATNRMGHMDTATAVANEAYGASDIGRILYESQVNDQAIFEAIVVSDLREIQGIREGTLLESEIQALNEASIKGFFEKIKARLKQFWEKVKGVFKDIIAKIALFVMRDGKKFVKRFDEVTKGFTMKGELTGCKYFTKKGLAIIKVPVVSDIETKINAQKNAESIDKKAVVSAELAVAIEGKPLTNPTEKEFKEAAIEALFTPKTINASNYDGIVKVLKSVVSDGKDDIKALREKEKKIEKEIKEAGEKIKKAEKLALGMSPSKEEKKDNAHVIRNISALVSAYEQSTSIIMGLAISATKKNIKNSYSILNKIMKLAGGGVHESADLVFEAAVAEGEVEEALEEGIEEVTETEKEAIEELKDAVDEEIKAEEE